MVGGSAGVGRAIAEKLASAGHDLIVASSDGRDLAALAADLRIRFGGEVVPVEVDLAVNDDVAGRIARAAEQAGAVDGLLLPAGLTIADDHIGLPAHAAERLVRINFLAIVRIVERLLPMLAARPRSVIVGFGSIAAVRGRARNVMYSAAKRALRSYFESLSMSAAGSSVTVQFYVLGYVDTESTANIRTLVPKVDPRKIAERVATDLHRDKGIAYIPGFWRFLAIAVTLLPRSVFARMRL